MAATKGLKAFAGPATVTSQSQLNRVPVATGPIRTSPTTVLPAMVLYAIHIQIDYLTRKVAVEKGP